MPERRVQFKWGVFDMKKQNVIVQIDIAPSNLKGEMVQGHTHGGSCFCHPATGLTESGIPLIVHNRDRESRRDRSGL